MLTVVPSSSVPVSTCPSTLCIAATNPAATAARSAHTPSPVSWPSCVKKPAMSLLCSVDFHSSGTPASVCPPV